MTWVKVNDRIADDPFAIEVGDELLGAAVRLAAYSARHSTDGKIPLTTAAMFVSADKVQRMIDAQILTLAGTVVALAIAAVGDDGDPDALLHLLHSDKVKADRAANAKRQAEARKRKREKAGEGPPEPCDDRHAGSHGVTVEEEHSIGGTGQEKDSGGTGQEGPSNDRHAVSHAGSHGVSHAGSHGVSHGPPDPTRPGPVSDLDLTLKKVGNGVTHGVTVKSDPMPVGRPSAASPGGASRQADFQRDDGPSALLVGTSSPLEVGTPSGMSPAAPSPGEGPAAPSSLRQEAPAAPSRTSALRRVLAFASRPAVSPGSGDATAKDKAETERAALRFRALDAARIALCTATGDKMAAAAEVLRQAVEVGAMTAAEAATARDGLARALATAPVQAE